MATLTFRIELSDFEPLISRTFMVSSDSSMYLLHHIIQIVMGWQNYHLYQFELEKMIFADRRLWDEGELGPITDGKEVSVGKVFGKTGTIANYEYDFGDSWNHHLELIGLSQKATNVMLPQVIMGANACPPEDCGGTHGYEQLLQIIKNPKHEQYAETLAWLGKKFNPNKFSVNEVNRKLGYLNRYVQEYEDSFQ